MGNAATSASSTPKFDEDKFFKIDIADPVAVTEFISTVQDLKNIFFKDNKIDPYANCELSKDIQKNLEKILSENKFGEQEASPVKELIQQLASADKQVKEPASRPPEYQDSRNPVEPHSQEAPLTEKNASFSAFRNPDGPQTQHATSTEQNPSAENQHISNSEPIQPKVKDKEITIEIEIKDKQAELKKIAKEFDSDSTNFYSTEKQNAYLKKRGELMSQISDLKRCLEELQESKV